MKINKFLGVRNTSPDRSLPDNSLSAALNVDIDDEGIITQRNGYALSKAVSNLTAAYTTQDQVTYVVSGGVLSRVDDSLNLVPIVASTATAFADFSKNLFTNDGLRIQADTASNLFIPNASGTGPELYSAPGNWVEGTYSAVICYRNTVTGLEGASSASNSITIAANSRVVVNPPPVFAGFTAIVYMTAANGAVYYDTEGTQISPDQLVADSFPVGAPVLAFYDSALYAALPQANGTSLLVWSLPFKFHIFDLTTNYAVVPGEIRAMKPVDGGLLIATDHALFAYDGANLIQLANYGVPKGRSLVQTPDKKVKIFSNRGACEALPFINLTETKALFAPGKQVSSALVDQNGIQKMVVLSDGSGTAFNIRT